MKVAECRTKDPKCGRSRSLAATAARELREGKTADEVRADLARRINRIGWVARQHLPPDCLVQRLPKNPMHVMHRTWGQPPFAVTAAIGERLSIGAGNMGGLELRQNYISDKRG